MSERRTYEPVRYEFTEDEKRELGEQLARENQRLFAIRTDKTAKLAEFASAIKATDKRIAELSEKLNLGFELRDVECMAILDDPRPGMKSLIRLDTNKVLRIEAMTLNEMQSSFGFAEGDEK